MTSVAEAAQPTLREIVTDALRYWEPRRIVYNAVLTAIVIGWFIADHSPFAMILRTAIFWFFPPAVMANVAYCAAYLVDIFVQLSGFRSVWLRYRWGLFLIGLAFASILTYGYARPFILALTNEWYDNQSMP
ncbi:MAG TPA: hypothetical protein VG733_10065 [Chthoniobacteraceae bacterium]|nr:hypothetical protein [Chthoniobacteraceae bacterium]